MFSGPISRKPHSDRHNSEQVVPTSLQQHKEVIVSAAAVPKQPEAKAVASNTPAQSKITIVKVQKKHTVKRRVAKVRDITARRQNVQVPKVVVVKRKAVKHEHAVLKQPSLEQLNSMLMQVTNETVILNPVKKETLPQHEKCWWEIAIAMDFVAWLAVVHMIVLCFWVIYVTQFKNKEEGATQKRSPRGTRRDPERHDSARSSSSMFQKFMKFGKFPKNAEHTPERVGEVIIPPLNFNVIERDLSSVPRYIPSGDSCGSSDICSLAEPCPVNVYTDRSGPVIHLHEDINAPVIPLTPKNLRFPSFMQRFTSVTTAPPAPDTPVHSPHGGYGTPHSMNTPHSPNSEEFHPSRSTLRERSESRSVKVRFPNGLIISTTADNISDVHDIVSETFSSARPTQRDDLSDDMSC